MSSLHWACQAFIVNPERIDMDFILLPGGMFYEISTCPTFKPLSRPLPACIIGPRRSRYVAALLTQFDLQRRFQPSDRESSWVTRELPHPSTEPPVGTFSHASFGSFCMEATIIQVEYAKRGPNDDTPLSHSLSCPFPKHGGWRMPPFHQRSSVSWRLKADCCFPVCGLLAKGRHSLLLLSHGYTHFAWLMPDLHMIEFW